MEVLTEWGVNLYKFKIDENEKILEWIFDSMKLDDNKVEQSDKWNAKISRVIGGEFPSPQPPILKFLIDKIENCISHIPKCKGLTLRVRQCIDLWVNIYNKGDYQGAHRHVNLDNIKYTFVYFAKYNPDTDAKLVFGNPDTTKLILISGEVKIIDEKFIPMNEGEVIIFPSYLPHYVEKHESDTQRITVSGNLCRI